MHYIRTIYSDLSRPKVTSKFTMTIQLQKKCQGMIADISRPNVSVVDKNVSVEAD